MERHRRKAGLFTKVPPPCRFFPGGWSRSHSRWYLKKLISEMDKLARKIYRIRFTLITPPFLTILSKGRDWRGLGYGTSATAYPRIA
jgi:hypothetical protein